ncbi:hypothetical protein [Rhizobium sp. MHM7A]|uniref:hypothetical protein n=1 Tax=Rhizobium sp. MHM7A TaxID=2583233 RepID=UPI001106A7CF|nr:hypothetical protein [Rhizobium sp. MHM7A]TLX17270.1 hypothetical protein FFR93_08210 [Rhizobium sp. MHM7A]
MSSASGFNKYVNLTDHHALRGHAITDFARCYGKFEGSGDNELADLFAEKITAIYAGQISMPVSEAWSKLPKVSTLVDAAKEGLALAEAPIRPESIELFEKSLRQVFERAVPALRELSINATVKSDTLQSLTGNLMALRDEAVETLKANGDGFFGALTRRINVRKAEELHNSYLATASDTALAGALSLTARELCQAAKNEVSLQSSQLDEIEVLKGVGERKAPSNAHATLSRLSDVGNFLDQQNTASYKVA